MMANQGNADQAGAQVAGFLQELAVLMEKYGVNVLAADEGGEVYFEFAAISGYDWAELDELFIDYDARNICGRLLLGNRNQRKVVRLNVDMLPTPESAE